MYYKKLFFTFLVIEIVIIFFLGKEVYRKSTVKTASISPLKREHLVFPKDGTFEHFYELKDHAPIEPAPWLPYPVKHTINSDGLNDRFDYLLEKPDGVFRIASLGDSWTFGMNVSTKDSYSEVLEDLLNDALVCKNNKKFEVLNFGVPGYDVEYSVERFRRHGQKYQPDLVVFFIEPSNLIHSSEFRQRELERYMAQAGITPRLQGKESINQKLDLVKKAIEDFEKNLDESSVYSRQVGALQKFSTYFGGTLVFFLHGTIKEQDTLIQEFAKSRENTYVYKHEPPLHADEIIPNDDHPTKEGHVKLAQGLFNYLTDRSIIPCE